MSMNYHKLRSSSSSLPMSTLFLSYDATHAFYSLCFSLSHGRFRTFFDGECRVAVIPDRDMGSTHLRWYFVQLQLRGTISKNAHCKLHSAGYWGRLFNGGYSPPDSPLEPPSSYLQSSTASFGSVLLFLTAVSRVPLPSILGTLSLSPSWAAARSKIKLEVPLLFPSRMILPRERERERGGQDVVEDVRFLVVQSQHSGLDHGHDGEVRTEHGGERRRARSAVVGGKTQDRSIVVSTSTRVSLTFVCAQPVWRCAHRRAEQRNSNGQRLKWQWVLVAVWRL